MKLGVWVEHEKTEVGSLFGVILIKVKVTSDHKRRTVSE